MTREEAEGLLAVAREAKLLGPDAKSWIDRLAPKRQDFVEAVRFLAENGDEEAAAELGANVWRLWLVLGDIAGGRQMLSAALDVGQGKPSRVRSLALYGDGALAFRAGAQQDSQVRNEEALAAARTVGDREAEALALVGLSRVALRNGDYGRVQSLAATARSLTQDLDPAAEVAPLHLLAAGTRLAGDYNRAMDLYAQSLELRGGVDLDAQMLPSGPEYARLRRMRDSVVHVWHQVEDWPNEGERDKGLDALRSLLIYQQDDVFMRRKELGAGLHVPVAIRDRIWKLLFAAERDPELAPAETETEADWSN